MMQGCRGGHTSLVLLLVAAAHALVDCFFLLVPISFVSFLSLYTMYHIYYKYYRCCSPPSSSSPSIVCTTYDIVIIDDIKEKEKETDIETKNDTKVRRKMQ